MLVYRIMNPDGHNSQLKNFNYYEVNKFCNVNRTWNKDKSLSIFHTNVQNLESNGEKMTNLLCDLKWDFDVIAVSEVWQDEKNKHNFSPPTIDGYQPYIGTTGSSLKGGCGLYVKSSLPTIPRPDLTFKIDTPNAECETFWIELKNGNNPGWCHHWSCLQASIKIELQYTFL